MPGGNEKVTHILKQTCSWTLSVQLQVCLSMRVAFLLPPGIEGLIPLRLFEDLSWVSSFIWGFPISLNTFLWLFVFEQATYLIG